MRTRSLPFGWLVASSLAIAASALEPESVTGRVAVADATAGTFVVETPTGRVAFTANDRTVFVRRDARTAIANLRAGEQIRVASAGAGGIAAHVEVLEARPASTPAVSAADSSVDDSDAGRLRRTLGLWLLATAGTMVALRARRMRLV